MKVSFSTKYGTGEESLRHCGEGNTMRPAATMAAAGHKNGNGTRALLPAPRPALLAEITKTAAKTGPEVERVAVQGSDVLAQHGKQAAEVSIRAGRVGMELHLGHLGLDERPDLQPSLLLSGE